MRKYLIPFGYKMTDGIVVIHHEEAKIIKQIFSDYVSGLSYQRIADSLGNDYWDKHKVKRALEDERYIGRQGFPEMIDISHFEKVRIVQKSKTQGYRAVQETIGLIRKRIICKTCGARVYRDTRARSEKWLCHDDCIESRLDDDILLNGVIDLQNIMIRNPRVALKKGDLELVSFKDIDAALQKLLDSETPDCDQLLQSIYNRAALAYRYCGDSYVRQKNKEIYQCLKGKDMKPELDISLFIVAARHILIAKNGAISLALMNGVIISKEVHHG